MLLRIIEDRGLVTVFSQPGSPAGKFADQATGGVASDQAFRIIEEGDGDD